MKKSIVGLVVAGATLSGVIASTSAACAVSVSGTDSKDLWKWGFENVDPDGRNATDVHYSLCQELLIGCKTYEYDITLAAGKTLNARNLRGMGVGELVTTVLKIQDIIFSYSTEPKFIEPRVVRVPVPVPWDISGSATIFGSITGIGLGIGLKRLKSKKNINLEE
jgi:hypothetical protein